MAQKYLTEVLTEKKIPKLELCSDNRNKLLTIPRTSRKTSASRSFSICVFGTNYQTILEPWQTTAPSEYTYSKWHTAKTNFFPVKHTS